MADTPSTVAATDVLAIDASIITSTGSANFGVTENGFIAKPFGRLLAEKLALGKALFGDDLDLTTGSVFRKLFELTALEDARTWSALAAIHDNCYVATATGSSLSRLGDELSLSRPFLEASGSVTFTLTGDLPQQYSPLTIPRGARLLTPGGHHVATDETVVLSSSNKNRAVAVVAFYPGPSHNLDPSVSAGDGSHPEKIDRFNFNDQALADLADAQQIAGKELVKIDHKAALTGGELQWSDDRYRALLLQAPRSIWTVDAMRIAVSLVPGVRQVVIRDGWGGLDLQQSIFGNFNFIERLFSSERDLGSPYYFSVLIAPTPAAIWDGPDGLAAAVASTLEDLRPIGIFPRIEQATQVGIAINANLVVRGIPLPSGTRDFINASQSAQALKDRLVVRLRKYVSSLQMGEPVRHSEIVWTFMNEPGVTDVRDLAIVRYPPALGSLDFASTQVGRPEDLGCGQNAELLANQIAVTVERPDLLTII
jgi:hypothetical protein